MNKTRIAIGSLLVAAGLILNKFMSGNDLADFLKGLFVVSGLVLLITSLIKKKK